MESWKKELISFSTCDGESPDHHSQIASKIENLAYLYKNVDAHFSSAGPRQPRGGGRETPGPLSWHTQWGSFI